MLVWVDGLLETDYSVAGTTLAFGTADPPLERRTRHRLRAGAQGRLCLRPVKQAAGRSVAAGMILADLIAGRSDPWAEVYDATGPIRWPGIRPDAFCGEAAAQIACASSPTSAESHSLRHGCQAQHDRKVTHRFSLAADNRA